MDWLPALGQSGFPADSEHLNGIHPPQGQLPSRLLGSVHLLQQVCLAFTLLLLLTAVLLVSSC